MTGIWRTLSDGKPNVEETIIILHKRTLSEPFPEGVGVGYYCGDDTWYIDGWGEYKDKDIMCWAPVMPIPECSELGECGTSWFCSGCRYNKNNDDDDE